MITASAVPRLLDLDRIYTLREHEPDGGPRVSASKIDPPVHAVAGSATEFGLGLDAATEVIFIVREVSGAVELRLIADDYPNFTGDPVLVANFKPTSPGVYRTIIDVAGLLSLDAVRGYRGLWLASSVEITGGPGSAIRYSASITRSYAG